MKGDHKTSIPETESLRILMTYKGSAETGKDFRDDYMILTLAEDRKPEPLARAVINFPEMEGEKVLFLHDLTPYEGGDREKGMLLQTVQSFAGRRGYRKICMNGGKQASGFLQGQGFTEMPGGLLFQKEVEA